MTGGLSSRRQTYSFRTRWLRRNGLPPVAGYVVTGRRLISGALIEPNVSIGRPFSARSRYREIGDFGQGDFDGERLPEGKKHVTSNSWDDERVSAPDQVLEVRWVDGRLHVARKDRHHDEWDRPVEGYDPGPGVEVLDDVTAFQEPVTHHSDDVTEV